uniref:Retrotransposon gag domain-containing protein n=1 Tax=Lactuca sativa TaxID=4236 RepID=A0A9R1WGM4_LACSA|nr:hypothetical protein LSAT_V11C200053080 [Lactuca sativa]
MEKDIRSNVKFAYANTTRDIWNDLEERFGKESAPRAYELQQSSQQHNMMEHCVRGAIGRRLNEAKDKERLYEFLMGLDIEYSTIKT